MYEGGSTNIYSPLEYVYSCKQKSGYLTQIFLISDGFVSNRKEVLDLVSSKSSHSRCFSLGIGNKVDQSLVRGIATNGGGTCEFVTDTEPIESKILKQLKTALQPALLKPVRDENSARLIPMHDTENE